MSFGVQVSRPSEDATKTPENNAYNRFYKMQNKHGREVPVPLHLEKEVLQRGFIHTDRAIYSDNLDEFKHIANPPIAKSPQEMTAEALKMLAEVLSEKKLEKVQKAIEEEEKAKKSAKKGLQTDGQ